MNDDLTILASVYLDNEATPEERAQVEANPQLLAEVERQRLIRAVLGDVEEPSISLREEHLAAALGAWDRLPEAERSAAARDTTPSGIDPAAAAIISTPAPTSLNRRRRSQSTSWLIGAAAALALVLAGGVLLQSMSLGSGDSDSSSADIPDPAADVPDPNSSTAIADDAADEFLRESELSTADAERAGGDSGAAESEVFAEESTEEDSIDINAEAPPQNEDLEVLSTPEQLGIFASDAVDAPISQDAADRTDAPAVTGSADSDLSDTEEAIENFEFPLCGGADYVVGPAEYRGEFVVVGVDESRNLAVAYLAIDCSVIAIARLP